MLQLTAFMLLMAQGCRPRPHTTSAGDQPTEAISDAGLAPTPQAPVISDIGPGVRRFDTELRDSANHRTTLIVLRTDLGKVDLSVVQPARHRLESLAGDARFTAVVNGGFFEPDDTPAGLLVDHRKRLATLRSGGGSGVLAIASGRAKLFPIDTMGKEAGGDFAVQCGPRLIEPDGRVGIRESDGKRAARTMACIRDDGHTLDIVLAFTRNGDRDGPVLLDAAHWLSGPIFPGDTSGCEAALNLDGGPSTGLIIGGVVAQRPFGPVPWAIALSAK
jgi:hypothetical protein